MCVFVDDWFAKASFSWGAKAEIHQMFSLAPTPQAMLSLNP